ncbi:PAS domain-containing protein [Desulfotomaculum copahuensis]|uniref:PAS domain-containing protein n=1 Tax=Desulfotomaculum copahuensis TaxID=1838280 RepID=A0A1B7LDX8_9FIRM|nr:PAS domain S-box protein [Desulfotomaculum copahuensis]OAT81297.1 hypothetical protein A6M21_00430 [Desulfotomaculum copahuensis]
MKDDDKSKEQLICELNDLRKQTRFYKNVLEQLPVCTIAYDETEKAIYRNKQSKIIDGYDDEQMLGLSRADYLSRLQIKPGKISKITHYHHADNNFRDGIYSLNETTLLTRDGNLKNVLLTGGFIYDDQNNFVCACGCALDISSYIGEIEYVDHKLQEQLFFMQRLVDTIPNPLYYKDINGLFLGCNKAFEEFTGLTKENIIGKTVFEVYPQDLAVKFHQMDAVLFNAPGIQIYETLFPYADGSRRNVILNKATYLDGNGTTAGLVGVAIDITERKQMEEA